MWTQLAQTNPRQNKTSIVAFNGFPHGLNTNIPSAQIAQTECAALINFKINPGGQLETRSPVVVYTSVATTGNAAVKTFIEVPIGGTLYELLVDDNDKLYYNNAGTPTLIGTLEGDTQIIGYNGVAILMDGAYLKYLDNVSSIKLVYDDGTGTSGYQYNNRTGDDDSDLDLGNGTNTRIASKFTSQTWETGYTIPPTTVTAKLKREGNGYTGTDNVDINIVIRKASDSSVMATKTFVAAPIATNISATATEYSATFESGDITNELALNTAYYISLEYANGDATNYVGVRCTDVTSGGVGYYYAGAAWNADTTANPIISLRPGMPPKASFGAVANSRLFLGGDPDNPGYVWFSNLTHLDWSTTDGGGYIGAVDENKNNYEIGAIVNLYGDLFVFGTEEQPYLCQLTGTSPSNYALPLTFQKVWSTQKTTISVVNDVFFGATDGVKRLSGVQEYGDLRARSISDPVTDRIKADWSNTSAFATYFPKDGQYLLCMPSYHRLLVSHVKSPTLAPEQQGVRYPWSEYEFFLHELTSSVYKWTLKGGETDIFYCEIAAGGDPGFNSKPDAITLNGQKCTNQTVIGNLADHQWFYGDDDSLGYSTIYFKDATGDPDISGQDLRTILIPSCFANFNDTLYIGGNDGFVYQLDSTDYKDQSIIHMKPKMATTYTEFPFSIGNLNDLQLNSSSKGGAGINVRIYTNGAQSTDLLTYALDVYDGLTVDEALMDVDDALFLVEATVEPLYKRININARSFQIMLRDVTLSGWPLYINGIYIKYRQTGLR